MNYKDYFDKFNANDEEIYETFIDNAHAAEFLLENAPRLYCPDSVIEETFAFRTWTLRKHFKKTEDGFVLTEFLPNVPWASTHNTICAPLCHHLNESRWFKNSAVLLDYISLFLDEKANAYAYSIPSVYEIFRFLKVTDNLDYAIENVKKLERNVATFEKKHVLPNGLFWSFDIFDAMELSISGITPEHERLKGIRPTLNSQMYAAYVTMEQVELLCGNEDKASEYRQKAEALKEKFNKVSFDGDFYKAIHIPEERLQGEVSFRDINESMNVRELIGYIPFIYNMADNDKADCFKYLKDESVFAANTGFATAEISHPRFLYEYNHECLWNGYVWPYATSQVLTAAINVLQNGETEALSYKDLYSFIKKYAEMHYDYSGGKKVNFIDESMRPDKRVWYSRNVLKEWGWPKNKGGFERGKDYNHSTFIDIVIRGLIGVSETAEDLSVKPNIKGIWKWFKLENLSFKNKSYDIFYDEDGTVFNKGKGVIIEERQ